MTRAPTFSIILPVCHGGRFLRDALASLRKLETPVRDFEIIAVGHEEDVESPRIGEELFAGGVVGFEYLHAPSKNRSIMLNMACAVARGEVLVFGDDDCIFPRAWLTSLKAAMDGEENLGVLGGGDRLAPSESAFDLALDWTLNSFVGTGGYRKASAGGAKAYPKLWNMAVPKAVALDVAGERGDVRPQVFDESLDVHEDVVLCHDIEQLGRRIVHAPDIVVTHCRDTTYRSFIARNFGMGRACRKAGVHRLPHCVLSAACAVTFALASLCCAMASTILCVVFAAWVGLYALAVYGNAVLAAVSMRRLMMLWWVPWLTVGAHAARAFGYGLPW